MHRKNPYETVFSHDDTEIRVGRNAGENEGLSFDKGLRDDDDIWMHASDFPGAHVVVCSGGGKVSPETLTGAATLAARRSKAPRDRNVSVDVVRCKQVAKDPRDKEPGSVFLTGKVRRVIVGRDGACVFPAPIFS